MKASEKAFGTQTKTPSSEVYHAPLTVPVSKYQHALLPITYEQTTRVLLEQENVFQQIIHTRHIRSRIHIHL